MARPHFLGNVHFLFEPSGRHESKRCETCHSPTCVSLVKLHRYGFGTPEDFNDHELYCGGWSRQHQRNKGLCGVCGDAYDLPQVINFQN